MALQLQNFTCDARVVGSSIHARALCSDSAGLQFAWYLYRGDEKVNVAWYSGSTECTFDAETPGYYRVQCFAKSQSGEMQTVKSAPLFARPVEVTAESFPAADATAVAFRLKSNHWTFPALYYPKDGKRLFVLMPSAVQREKARLPAFHRWTWKDLFPGDVLCVADPTLELHKDLRLGWLLGHKDHIASDELVPFVISLARARGIANENIVFWGSSAGGFAALALAASIPGSAAVAINSQTDAMSYHVTEQVDLVRQVCFDGMSEQAIRSTYVGRVNMMAAWAANKDSRALLAQNQLDAHHFNVHFKPFLASLGGEVREGVTAVGRHKAWLYKDAGGHAPESREMAAEILNWL